MKRVLLALALVALAACKDNGQKSATEAKANVQSLVDLTAKDVAEVERGLPEGAKKLDALLTKEIGKDGDPKTNAPAVRTSLQKMRQQVPDLGIAKSTFFALADDKGIGIRNDAEQDGMAGKNLVDAWPGLKPVTTGSAYVATVGKFPGQPSQHGADKEWVAAVPVKRADGSTSGILVTGWTFRRFAYHLQATLQREIQDQLMRAGDKGKMPILYVCLFDKDDVYGAALPGSPPVPPVNEKALKEADVFGKTANGPADGPIKIENRDFGWAAARLPKLDANVGVVLLRSEI